MKILITGISGLLGLNAAVALRGQHTVVGSYHDRAIVLPGVQARRLDITDGNPVRRWVQQERPEIVLHTAGLTNVESCEANPALAQRLNVDAAAHVAAAAALVGARLIHVSTDHLFDGASSLYAETAATSPVNVYAITKLAAETAVRREHPGAHVVRTNFYGWGHPGRVSFSDWIIGALRSGQTLTMFHDVYFTPSLANGLIEAALELVERADPGIYNLAGGERLSKYEFGRAVADRFGFDAELIRPVSVATFAFKARRPLDMSLSTEKAARSLGHPLMGVAAGIDRLKRLEDQGLPKLLADAISEGQP